MKYQKVIYYVILLITILLSFRCYSSLFYPALNSDNAVMVLMIKYLHLPEDLYFWKQDRLGSIIPLIAQVFYKGFGLSVLVSESVTHYLILLVGFLAFSTFLKSNFYKIVFAIIWFFPPMRLIDVTQFAFGIHYSLLAVSCYLYKKSEGEAVKEKIVLKHLILFLNSIVQICAVWVSDMAIVSVFLLVMLQFYPFKLDKNWFRGIYTTPVLWYALLTTVVGYTFIHYAKSISIVQEDYAVFNDLATIGKTISIFSGTLLDLLLFRSDEPFTSVYSYLCIAIIVYSFFVLRHLKIDTATKKWLLFFLFDAIILFIIILISRWTYVSSVPRRYFTCTYIALSFVLLLLFDNWEASQKKIQLLKFVLISTVFIGGIGTLYNLAFVWPGTLKPMVQVTGEFKQLGKIGIIANYWNAYIISCTDPDNIKATPHDQLMPAVRSAKIVGEVFEQKNIYIVKDMWLESFPDTLSQFGRVLVRDSSAFTIGGCEVCRYRKAK